MSIVMIMMSIIIGGGDVMMLLLLLLLLMKMLMMMVLLEIGRGHSVVRTVEHASRTETSDPRRHGHSQRRFAGSDMHDVWKCLVLVGHIICCLLR